MAFLKVLKYLLKFQIFWWVSNLFLGLFKYNNVWILFNNKEASVFPSVYINLSPIGGSCWKSPTRTTINPLYGSSYRPESWRNLFSIWTNIFFPIIHTSLIMITFTPKKRSQRLRSADLWSGWNFLLIGRCKAEWHVAPATTNTAVSVVPRQSIEPWRRLSTIFFIEWIVVLFYYQLALGS